MCMGFLIEEQFSCRNFYLKISFQNFQNETNPVKVISQTDDALENVCFVDDNENQIYIPQPQIDDDWERMYLDLDDNDKIQDANNDTEDEIPRPMIEDDWEGMFLHDNNVFRTTSRNDNNDEIDRNEYSVRIGSFILQSLLFMFIFCYFQDDCSSICSSTFDLIEYQIINDQCEWEENIQKYNEEAYLEDLEEDDDLVRCNL